MPSPTFQINGVPCSLKVDGVGEDAMRIAVPPTGLEMTAKIMCDWVNLEQVLIGLRGYVYISGFEVIRLPPYRCPLFPGLYCMEISDIYGIKYRTDQATAWPTYQFAVITCHFRYPTFGFTSEDPRAQNDPTGLPWTTTKIRVSGEVMNIPGGGYFFLSGPDRGKPVPGSSATLIRPHAEVSITRHMMPFVPLEELLSLQGTVNFNPVTLADHTFPTGTMLFYTANSTPQADSQGNESQELEYVFLTNYSVDFNEVMGSDGLWHLINTAPDGSGDFPFPYVDAFAILP